MMGLIGNRGRYLSPVRHPEDAVMTENALDDALADLVEAFGHVSEAELQAFLDGTPRSDAGVAATERGSGALPLPLPARAVPDLMASSQRL